MNRALATVASVLLLGLATFSYHPGLMACAGLGAISFAAVAVTGKPPPRMPIVAELASLLVAILLIIGAVATVAYLID